MAIILTILFSFIGLVCFTYFCKSIFDITSNFVVPLFSSIASFIIAVIFGTMIKS